ncbi:glycosyltransferase family 1 protein [Methylosinus sp. Sm6]|uniref:glycosyltransferase family 4 protein n=1 Tax=Methylosinus sp. Sm6 TaxID=2866948 RepID=UPI001C9964D1|nr:glycosyltransferase family 1 protein [Methylosinus sp. Sm6]MBY6242950.1 glycosyltransferase family 4 protein [Methylosinus sp. Sm6]
MTAAPVRRRVVYDVTRLVTRALNRTPNGIDRVDFALARHFLEAADADDVALACAALGPRLARASDALRTLVDIETYWNEFVDPSADPAFEALIRAFDAPPATGGAARVRRSGLDMVAENGRAMRRWAFRLGRSTRQAPRGAVYVNASQFPLHKDWHLRWLERRPDVKPVFFVHDLLPLEAPEFFRPAEQGNHLRAMRNIVRLAAGVIVGSEAVARRLRAFAAEEGRADLPLCRAGLPVAPAFANGPPADPRLAGRDYFVCCGTIEPRKNHMTLLAVWRDLAEHLGPATPKLALVGKRGWHNENVLDLLERSAALRPHVIEASGLSTPALRSLLAGARAALAPSFGEGFGLPVAEAAACGAPIIASDIETFREIAAGALDYVDPLDGLGWRDAVLAYCEPGSRRRAEALRRLAGFPRREVGGFFQTVDDFIAGL